MASRLRATLRGVWWRKQVEAIRHCSFCGGRLAKRYVRLERQWRPVCVRCGEISYHNPKVVAGVIPVMPDGRVVLLRREIEPAKGKWTYPAGYQEMGESSQEAAVRETQEEICVRVKIKDPLNVYSYADAGVVTIVYVGRVLKKEKPSPGIESQEVRIFQAHEIPWKHLAFRSTVQALRDWTKKRKPKKTAVVLA